MFRKVWEHLNAPLPLSFTNVQASVVPDQIGVPQLVLIGLTVGGGIWKKVGEGPWTPVDTTNRATA